MNENTIEQGLHDCRTKVKQDQVELLYTYSHYLEREFAHYNIAGRSLTEEELEIRNNKVLKRLVLSQRELADIEDVVLRRNIESILREQAYKAISSGSSYKNAAQAKIEIDQIFDNAFAKDNDYEIETETVDEELKSFLFPLGIITSGDKEIYETSYKNAEIRSDCGIEDAKKAEGILSNNRNVITEPGLSSVASKASPISVSINGTFFLLSTIAETVTYYVLFNLVMGLGALESTCISLSVMVLAKVGGEVFWKDPIHQAWKQNLKLPFNNLRIAFVVASLIICFSAGFATYGTVRINQLKGQEELILTGEAKKSSASKNVSSIFEQDDNSTSEIGEFDRKLRHFQTLQDNGVIGVYSMLGVTLFFASSFLWGTFSILLAVLITRRARDHALDTYTRAKKQLSDSISRYELSKGLYAEIHSYQNVISYRESIYGQYVEDQFLNSKIN